MLNIFWRFLFFWGSFSYKTACILSNERIKETCEKHPVKSRNIDVNIWITKMKKEMQIKKKKRLRIKYTIKTDRLKHGTIIRTGITRKIIPSYMRDSAYRWLIVENDRISRSYVKHFWIFPRERNCTILIGLCKKVSMNHPIMFLDRDNKRRFAQASFSYYLELLWQKNKF